MKSMFLLLALLSAPVLMADSVISHIAPEITVEQLDHAADDTHAESKAAELDAPDDEDLFFDDGLELPPVPAPRDISPVEAYAREFGISILLQYVAAKMWLEHQWKVLTSSPS